MVETAARRRLGVVWAALALVCTACSSVSDPAAFSVVAQDKYDFHSCKEIIGARTGLTNREKDLRGLVEKAESSPGGFIVSYSAYRSELVQVRGQLAAAQRAARVNKCDAAPQP